MSGTIKKHLRRQQQRDRVADRNFGASSPSSSGPDEPTSPSGNFAKSSTLPSRGGSGGSPHLGYRDPSPGKPPSRGGLSSVPGSPGHGSFDLMELRKELAEKTEELEGLHKANKSLEEELQIKSLALEQMDEDLRRVRTGSQSQGSSETEVRELREKVRMYEEREREWEREREELTDRMAEGEGFMVERVREVEKKLEASEMVRESAEKALELLKGDLEEVEGSRERAEKELREVKAELESQMEGRVTSGARHEMEKLSNAVDQDMEMMDLKREVDVLRMKLRSMEGDHKELCARAKKLEKENLMMKAEMQSKGGEMERAREAEREERAIKEGLLREKEELYGRIGYLEAEARKQRETVQVLEREVRLAQGGSNGYEHAGEEQQNARAMAAEIEALQEELEGAREDKEATVTELLDQVVALNDRLSQVRRDKDAAIIAAERKIEALRRELSLMVEDNEMLHAELDRSSGSVGKAEEYLKALDVARVEIKRLRLERDLISDRLRTAEQQASKGGGGPSLTSWLMPNCLLKSGGDTTGMMPDTPSR